MKKKDPRSGNRKIQIQFRAGGTFQLDVVAVAKFLLVVVIIASFASMITPAELVELIGSILSQFG